jgi:hypothetical protein
MKKTILFLVVLFFAVNIFAQDTLSVKKVKTMVITTSLTETEEQPINGDAPKTTVESKTDTTVTEEMNYEVKQKPKYWSFGTKFHVGLNQIAFVNWFAGGANAVSGIFENSSFIHYAKNGLSWKNDLYLAYGMQWQQGDVWYDAGGTATDKPRLFFKNADQMLFSSIFGFKAAKHWYYSALLKFQSQFDKGYKDRKAAEENFSSRFLTPAYLTFSVGMEYNTTAQDLQIYLSPVALEMTFVLDTSLSKQYSVVNRKGDVSHFKYNFGPYAYIKYKKQWGNFSLETRLDVIYNLLNLKGSPFPKVDWVTMLGYSFNKWLAVSIKTEFLYNPDHKFPVFESDGITPVLLPDGNAKTAQKMQFMENIQLSFTYAIATK